MRAVFVMQMKERYTHLRPYGEWLAEQTVSLEDITASVGTSAAANGNGADLNGNGAALNGNGAAVTELLNGANGSDANSSHGNGTHVNGSASGVQRLLAPLKVPTYLRVTFSALMECQVLLALL